VPDCEWTASENLSWISLSRTSGTGSGTVQVTVAANTGAARTATITIAGRAHTISQADGCTYTIAPVEQTVESSGGSYDVTVTTSGNNCNWTASENSAWISLSRTGGTGTGTVRVTVEASNGGARRAQITIADQTHTVNQGEFGDNIPPSVPTGITLSPANGWLSAVWNASSDNVGVYRYEVSLCQFPCEINDYIGNFLVYHPETRLDYSEVEPGVRYCAAVRACDAALNCSDYSTVDCLTMPP
jgi:hypothetical protein